MRILVCGGRDFNNWDRVEDGLGEWLAFETDELAENITLVHGGARGADSLAAKWAESVDMPTEEYKADWNTHGKAAGPIRNQQMLDTGIDYVIAFPGGKGTEHMKTIARKAGVPVIEA